MNISAILFNTPVKHATFIPGKRAQYIANAFASYDIVAFQEIMNIYDNYVIKNRMQELGFEYFSEKPCDSWVCCITQRYLVSGGVRIFSKHPIIEKDTMVFSRCHYIESFTAKGVVYTKIKIDEQQPPLNVFALHAQSSREHIRDQELELQFVENRAKQFTELKTFIDSKNIPENETILVVGDFNVHNGKANETNPALQHPTPEFMSVLRKLSAQVSGEYTEKTLPFTLDVNTNTFTKSIYPQHNIRANIDHILCVNTTNGHITHPCLTNGEHTPKLWVDALKDEEGFDLSDHHRLTLETVNKTTT